MKTIKTYGYALKSKAQSPAEMSEVSIVTDAATLRLLAAFLVKTAEAMESNPTTFGHEHLKDYIPQLNGCDFIVCMPTREE